MICCKFKVPHIREELIFSYIYASNCKIERRQLWSELIFLSTHSEVVGKSWALLGDFNQTLNPNEDSSSGTRIRRGMADFRDFLFSAGLFDLSCRGLDFTWWNNQEGNPISKKLDRVLVNDNWQVAFPLSYGFFDAPDFSDHSPSCLVVGSQDASNTPFMFSHFLIKHKVFLPTVAQHWNSFEVEGTAMFVLSKKTQIA